MPSVPGVVRVSDQRQNRKSVRLSLPINSLPSAVRAEVNFALSFTASRSYGSSRGPFKRTVEGRGFFRVDPFSNTFMDHHGSMQATYPGIRP